MSSGTNKGKKSQCNVAGTSAPQVMLTKAEKKAQKKERQRLEKANKKLAEKDKRINVPIAKDNSIPKPTLAEGVKQNVKVEAEHKVLAGKTSQEPLKGAKVKQQKKEAPKRVEQNGCSGKKSKKQTWKKFSTSPDRLPIEKEKPKPKPKPQRNNNAWKAGCLYSDVVRGRTMARSSSPEKSEASSPPETSCTTRQPAIMENHNSESVPELSPKQSAPLVSPLSGSMLVPDSESTNESSIKVPVENSDSPGITDDCTANHTCEVAATLNSTSGVQNSSNKKKSKNTKKPTSVEPVNPPKKKSNKPANPVNRKATESASAKPNKQSASPNPNKQSASSKPNKQSASPNPNKQSASPKPNKQSASPKPNKQSGSAKPNKQSASAEPKLPIVAKVDPAHKPVEPNKRNETAESISNSSCFSKRPPQHSKESNPRTIPVKSERACAAEMMCTSREKYMGQTNNPSSLDAQKPIPDIKDLPAKLPFGAAVHGWNFYNLDDDFGSYPKFLCQFDDEHYLEVEKKAMAAFYLQMSKKQDKAKAAQKRLS